MTCRKNLSEIRDRGRDFARIPLLALLPWLCLGCGAGDRSGAVVQVVPQSAGTSEVSLSQIPNNGQDSAVLRSESPETTVVAFPAPRESERESRARELFQRLTDPQIESEAWDTVHAELIGLGSDSARVLSERLRAGSPLEREMAAMTLALLGADARAATESLIASLHDESPFVRANAAAALVQIPGESAKAVPALVELLESREGTLRQLAAANLGVINDEAAPYAERLARSIVSDSDPEVMIPVVELLGRMGPSARSALPDLRQIAFEVEGEARDVVHATIQRIDGSSGIEAAP